MEVYMHWLVARTDRYAYAPKTHTRMYNTQTNYRRITHPRVLFIVPLRYLFTIGFLAMKMNIYNDYYIPIFSL